MSDQPRPNEEQVDIFGRLFARILDKRDGTGTQEAVDEVIEEFIAYEATIKAEAMDKALATEEFVTGPSTLHVCDPDLCCRLCKTHVTPHRNCILR